MINGSYVEIGRIDAGRLVVGDREGAANANREGTDRVHGADGAVALVKHQNTAERRGRVAVQQAAGRLRQDQVDLSLAGPAPVKMARWPPFDANFSDVASNAAVAVVGVDGDAAAGAKRIDEDGTEVEILDPAQRSAAEGWSRGPRPGRWR